MTAPTDAATSGWEAARDEGIRLLEERDFAGAAERLDAASSDPSGESEGLLGLAHFHSERYDEAARHYAGALEADGDQPEWRHMLAACQANADAEVHVPVPDVHYFDRDELLLRWSGDSWRRLLVLGPQSRCRTRPSGSRDRGRPGAVGPVQPSRGPEV